MLFDNHSRKVLQFYILWLFSSAAIVYLFAAFAAWAWYPSNWEPGIRLAAALFWTLPGLAATLATVIECSGSTE